ncbi:cation-translocating P-type ATPase [Botryobacter ruber]|uniref:cation-translocating P-type ATPase n=1 Tax=Botryobacter ruber TaxID=2171629 RepID=UPI000E0AE827|nr:cation-transporting P-type ATPase [Botryobacter ruber]
MPASSPADIFRLPPEQVAAQLQTSPAQGLTTAESAARLKRFGYNQIRHINKRNMLQVFLEQYKNVLVLLLLGSCVISFFLGYVQDAIVLLLVVFFNTFIGFYQDWKSENLLASLKELVQERCYVLREGRKLEIPARELVPGDVVYLSEGDGVPADIRLFSTTGFVANEFILTGESQSRIKEAARVPEEAAGLNGRDNAVFMGTTVAGGEATGVVVATGMQTELGRIARTSETIDASLTPLQKELNVVAKKITIATLVLASLLFTARMLLDSHLHDALLFTIGVAAAMVPEGLPAQISVSLALGVARLARKKAVVKKLSAVEALGAATVIASDKTGTITKNEMSIIHCYLNGQNYTVTGTGYEPTGQLLDLDSHVLHKDNLENLKPFFLDGYLASTGKINPPDKYHATWYPLGDPTDCAFSTLVLKAGFQLEDLDQQYPRKQLFPFDSFRKRTSIVRRHKNKTISFIKGALESVLETAVAHEVNFEVKPLLPEEKEHFLNLARLHAAEGKRIIALAYKDLPLQETYTLEEAETATVFAGFVTMVDPPHEQVKAAVQTAFEAGMKLIMLTGDNEVTARAIANQVGMHNPDGSLPAVIDEQLLKTLDDVSLKKHLEARTLIFSRVSPDEKLKIVTLLKESGEVVAVTGDGVNDTLSLKKADIGIAMGQKGSKVAQEAAGMVLLNDDFSTIVVAIQEGRTIYNNLRKNVLANLIGNLAELTVILLGFAAAFRGMPMALLAIHILLIDLIGNMLPLLMLSFDPPEEDLMHRPPRRLGEMLNKQALLTILYSGLIKGLISYAVFLLSFFSHAGHPLQHPIAMTVTLTSIVFCQFVNIFSSRTSRTVFTRFFFSNRLLFFGMSLSAFFVFVISYLPFFNRYFRTGPLAAADWALVLGGALVYLIILEVLKRVSGKRNKYVSDKKMQGVK